MEHVMKILKDPSEEETLVDMLDNVASGEAFEGARWDAARHLAGKLIAAMRQDGVDTDKYPIEN